MAFFKELAEQLKNSTEAKELKYVKARGLATGEGERYEEGTLALVFLRCLRDGLQFALSSNDAAGGKFDDIVLCWKNNESVSALFVQLKYKTSPKHTTIRISDLMWRKKDNMKEKKNDFSLNMYHDSYKKMRDSLDGGSYSVVLCTNLELDKDAQHMFVKRERESVPGMKLLDSGGCLYSLKSEDADVNLAVDNDTQFIQHFYLFSNQSNNEAIKLKIYKEIKEILGVDEKYCEAVREKLYTCLRKWMNTEDVRLTSKWDSWLNVVATYVTSCNTLVTRIKYRSVETLQKHIRGCNPAWIRPPGKDATALSATKVHQAVCGERHIMVSVSRLRELEKKILCCWGTFCRWLVIVDDDEHSSDDLLRMGQLTGHNRRLVIVSYKGDDSFRDTCESGDICDNSWKEFTDVKIKLNGDCECNLEDLCGTEALKALLKGRPEALVALSQLSGPVRMGQDLDPLPKNHISRHLTSRTHVTQDFFSSLGEKEVCIMDEVSYNLLTMKSVLKKTVRFEELENYLSASDAEWPVFAVAKEFDHSAIHAICSKHVGILVYVLSYGDDAWEILFLSGGSEKIRPYVKEKSKSLLQIVNGLSNRVLVEGKPGIGKSTMLLDMASQMKDEPLSWWVLKIDLVKYTEVFDSCGSGVEASEDILRRSVYNEKNLGVLEHALLQRCLLEYPRIICMFDGFDEICPDYAGKCLQVIQELAPRRGKLVVTTRPSVTDRLEAALGVLAHSVPVFSEDQLHLFHGSSLSESGVTDPIRDLLKIPLFSKIYADSLGSGIVVHDIVSLYEAFFERKLRRLHEEKLRNDLSKTGNKKMFERERRKHQKQLRLLAVTHLLPRLEVPGLAQSYSIDRDDLRNGGIIYQFVNDRPIFIHRTFAEHFLAKWCLSDAPDSLRADVYRIALSDSSLEFFVESFDRMASRDRPLLMAVLNDRESELKSMLKNGADPTEVDNVGRNSLHLAAVYGPDSAVLRLLLERLEAVAAARAGAGGVEDVAGAAGPSPYVEAAAAALGAEDGLLHWTPLRYAAERRRWRTVAALLEMGAQLRHLEDFQRGLHSPEQLWRIFKKNGYVGLFRHILGLNEEEWNLMMVQLQAQRRSTQIQVGVTIAYAEMSTDQYVEISTEAQRHSHLEVLKFIWPKILDMEKSRNTGFPDMELSQGSSQLGNSRRRSPHKAWLGSSSLSHLIKKQIRRKFQQLRTANDGATLHYAAATGDTERARRLIQSGADVNEQNTSGLLALHLAADAGSVDCIKWLLSAGADVNRKDNDEETALHFAARTGSAQSMRVLLNAGADALVQDSEGDTPLHTAVICGKTECVRLLIEDGSDVRMQNSSGLSALHVAALRGSIDCIKWLLSAGADVNLEDKVGWTSLHYAASTGSAATVRLLLDAGADVLVQNSEGYTPLHMAALSGNTECVSLLLEAGSDVNLQNSSSLSALHLATATGSVSFIMWLLYAAADVNLKDIDGRTALHSAARLVSAHIVRILLDAAADAFVQDYTGSTPLHMAAISGNTDCVRLLIEVGADVNLQNSSGLSALHVAKAADNVDCIKCLLSAGTDVNLKDNDGGTALHSAAVLGSAHSVRLLLDAGADALVQNSEGDTPLHRAARLGNTDCVRLLVEAGADVNLQNSSGLSALHVAQAADNVDCIKCLLSAGTDVNLKDNNGETALHCAAMLGSAHSVRLLLDAGADALVQNSRGHTPLHRAALSRNTECVRLLLDAGSDVNLQNSNGESALHVAVATGSVSCIKWLLYAAADVNLKDNDGRTALHYAAMLVSAHSVRLLLDAGADAFVQDSEGNTPLHTAAVSGNTDCVRLLIEVVADIGMQNSSGLSALHLVGSGGSVDCIKWPLSAGADVNLKDNNGHTALHRAASSGSAESVRLLLDAGADALVQCSEGYTPLHMAAISGNTDCVRLLVGAGSDDKLQNSSSLSALHLAAAGCSADSIKWRLYAGSDVNLKDNSGETALHCAARTGRAEIVRLLLDSGADVLVQDYEGSTPLHTAAISGNAECAKLLVEAGADVKLQNSRGLSALHVAAGAGSANCIMLLLSAGADVNLKDNFGRTVLYYAARTGSAETVRLVLDAGSDALVQDSKGYTPLHMAALSGNTECLRLLIEASADIKMHNSSGVSALHLGAAASSPDCIKLLLSAGAYVNLNNDDGWTALHFAASTGSAESVRLLLDAGAGALVQCSEGWTPLHVAAKSGNTDCVRFLVEAGGDVKCQNHGGVSALHVAADAGSANCIMFLLSAGADVNMRDSDGGTALHRAARSGSAESVRLLLDAGADVLLQCCTCGTPLHTAAMSGNTECVRLLIEAGADVRTQNSSGLSALHLAARDGSVGCIKSLLSAGADVNLKDNGGETPLHCAARAGSGESVRLLMDAGADALVQNSQGYTPLREAEFFGKTECINLLSTAV